MSFSSKSHENDDNNDHHHIKGKQHDEISETSDETHDEPLDPRIQVKFQNKKKILNNILFLSNRLN
jgi:hypothetical protein